MKNLKYWKLPNIYSTQESQETLAWFIWFKFENWVWAPRGPNSLWKGGDLYLIGFGPKPTSMRCRPTSWHELCLFIVLGQIVINQIFGYLIILIPIDLLFRKGLKDVQMTTNDFINSQPRRQNNNTIFIANIFRFESHSSSLSF